MRRRATKVIIGLEHIPCVRLGNLGLFRLGREGQGDPYSTFQYLNKAYKKARKWHVGIGHRRS